MWYELTDMNQIVPGRISAVVEVPPDSPWFRGHFPGEPILPGMALIAMVHEIVCRARGGDRPVQALRRVRFKQIVRPGDKLEITVSFEPGDKEKNTFHIVSAGEVVSSGHMIF